MASPTCEVKDGAAAYQSTTDGANVTPGQTVTIRLASQAGVRPWSIACVSVDDLSNAAAVNASLVIDSVAKTATFTAPVAGRAYRFQSTINQGIGADGVARDDYSVTFGVYTQVGGLRVHAVDELFESNSVQGWGADVNALIRARAGALTLEGITDRDYLFANEGAVAGSDNLQNMAADGNVRHAGTPVHQETYGRFIAPSDAVTDFKAEVRPQWNRVDSPDASAIALMTVAAPAASWSAGALIVVQFMVSVYAADGTYAFCSVVVAFKRAAGTLAQDGTPTVSVLKGSLAPVFTAAIVDNDSFQLFGAGYAARWTTSAHEHLVKKL